MWERDGERNEDGCSPHLIPAFVVRVEIRLPSLSLFLYLSLSFVKYSKQAKQTFGILCTPHGLTRAIQQPLVRFDWTETFRSRKIVFSFRLLFRGSSFFPLFFLFSKREREIFFFPSSRVIEFQRTVLSLRERPNERGNFTQARFVVTVKLLSAKGRGEGNELRFLFNANILTRGLFGFSIELI